MPDINILQASAQEMEAIQDLWSEYWESLELPADFQNFTEERSSLPGIYAPPKGRLLLALFEGKPAGTAALRPLKELSCEAKRLYVRPLYRGHGIGKALLSGLIEEARREGYEVMYGDTLKSMNSALHLYRQMGFSEVAPYSSSPTPNAIFLKLVLQTPNVPL